MPAVTVEPVRSRRQRKLFLDFPWRLYRDDPLWMPPLRRDEAELVGFRPHPFYRRNEGQTFLAFRGGEVCGRIAAVHNRAHNEYLGEKRGFFGFFECRDDPRAAAALLEAARGWLAQRGLHHVRGPVSPSIHYTVGALVEGFDSPPAFLMPYNPPYYGSLIEGCGFRKEQDLYAYRGEMGMLPDLLDRLAVLYEKIKEHHGIRIRTLNRRRFKQDVTEFLSVVTSSLVGHWGFAPLPEAELDYLAKGLSWLLVPELAVGAEVNGSLVGVSLAILDYNPRIKKIRGRLFPFGFLRLLLGKRHIRKMRVVGANVLPAYHLMGVGLVLLGAMVPKGVEWGMEEAEFSWIAESNVHSRRPLEKGGATRSKTYRVFCLDP